MTHESRPGPNQDSSIREVFEAFERNDPNLKIMKLIKLLRSTSIDFDDSTSISVTRRNNESNPLNRVIIGTQPYPDAMVKRWNMGTNTPEEQIVVKLAHELAHAYQMEQNLDQSVVDYLNGVDRDYDPVSVAFIELYAKLSAIGHINPLVEEPIYDRHDHGQFRIDILEDITELMSSYILSDKYFLYRLSLSMTELSDEDKTFIMYKTVEICKGIDDVEN